MNEPGMFAGYSALVAAFYLVMFLALLISAWKRSVGMTMATLGGFLIANLYGASVLTEGTLPSGEIVRIVGIAAAFMIVIGLLLALFGGKKKRPTTPTPAPRP
ncbi:MAG: hypothetical protein HZB75_03725 [Candidatus Saccharibacteria bacterium]|jgi:hypothetical protein|nr:MAG: hypothetical protein HZB75_03725 [Candidatus Saccharibacteria bacterium]